MDEKIPKQFGAEKMQTMETDFLNLFWILAEGIDDERVQSAKNLLQRLAESKTNQKYSIRRLTRGLASSRRFARVGFAVALTKLLREIKDIKIRQVLECIAEELKVSGHDSKSEVGSKLLGSVFAYGAIIQSERTIKGKQLKHIVQELISLGGKKAYLHPTCTLILLDLIGRLPPQVLKEIVWPCLQSDLNKGWVECTADRLILLFACRNKDRSLINKAYLKRHWGAAGIIDKNNYQHILQLLKVSVDNLQTMPMLLSAIATEVTQEIDDIEALTDFWRNIGNPLLTSTVPRQQIALSLFCQLLDLTSNLTLAQNMLFPAAAALICKIAERKDDQLGDVCARIELLLVELGKDKADETALLAIVKGFLQTSHRLKTISFLHSSSFSALINSLGEKAVKEFSQICMDCILGKTNMITQENGKTGEAYHSKPFNRQLVLLLRIVALHPSVQQSELKCHTLQFIFLHAFFKVSKATSDIVHCTQVSPDFAPFMRSACQATFYRILTQLLSMKPEKTSLKEHLLSYIEVLSELAHFAQKLLTRTDCVQPVKNISEKTRKDWQTVLKVIAEESDQKHVSSKNSHLGEMETFNLLILHLAFNLFTDPENTQELLNDIYICRQNAAKKLEIKKGLKGEPGWMEVLTEILLSILSHASKLARKTAVAVFNSLLPRLTPAALHLITEVLKNKSKSPELLEFEDVDDTSSEGSEDENSIEENDENDQVVQTELRNSVRKALGSAAVASEEDEDVEDLTDSEMLKLDTQLAAAFQSMKGPDKTLKKRQQKEIATFKLRVFDLLEVVVNGDRCGDFVIELLEPLLNLVFLNFKGTQNEEKQADVKPLYSRATDLFHVICNKRNLSDHIHSQEEIMDALSALIKLAQSGSNTKLATEIANGCLCILRLVSRQADSRLSFTKKPAVKENHRKEPLSSCQDKQDIFVQTIQASLEEDVLKRKHSKINMAFFSTMIEKYPTVFWPLWHTVLTSLQSPHTRVHTKTQACSLLVQLLRSNKRENLPAEEWNNFMSSVPPVLKELVLSQQKESLKAGLLLEVLRVLSHTLQMTTVEERTTVILPPELLQYLNQLKTTFSKDARKIYNKLSTLNRQPDHQSKKAKKRKCQDTKSAVQVVVKIKKKT